MQPSEAEQVAGAGRPSPPSELGHRAHGHSRAVQRETAEDSRVLVQSEEEQDTGSRQDLSAGTPFHGDVASRRGYSPPLAQTGTSRLAGSLGLLRSPGLGDGWLRPGVRPSPVTRCSVKWANTLKVSKNSSLKPSAASLRTASWCTDAYGFLAHSPSGEAGTTRGTPPEDDFIYGEAPPCMSSRSPASLWHARTRFGPSEPCGLSLHPGLFLGEPEDKPYISELYPAVPATGTASIASRAYKI